MYGMYPKKGVIKIGSDADLTIWDPNLKKTIKQEFLNHGSDYTPYEGLDITGWPLQTWLRGKCIFNNGTFSTTKNNGEYINRDYCSL